MKRYLSLLIILLTGFHFCYADTFKHRQTGEIFHGFATQKTAQNKTLTYIKEKEQFQPVNLAEYDITIDTNGRRNNVVVIPITQHEIMLSEVVATAVSETIEKVSNNGPYFIIVEIDSPGGRGDYMRKICESITNTQNCPVFAYITSQTSGGAYSAAAGVAMACDKVYIAPTASMGAIGPSLRQPRNSVPIQDFTNTFSAASLSAFGNYISGLAQSKGRPGLIARAMVDRTLEIVEVVDSQGNRSFIEKSDRKSTQTIVRTLTKPSLSDNEQSETLSSSGSSTWMLTAADAVDVGIADKVADSLAVILQEHNAADTQVITNRQAQKTIKKFASVKREVDRSLEVIQQLHIRADNLVNQYNEIDARYRENTMTSPINPGTNLESRRRNRITQGDAYDMLNPQRVSSKSMRDRRNMRNQMDAETMQMFATAQAIVQELAMVLNTLAGEYNNVIRLAERWPGTLPEDMSIQTLQTGYNSVLTLQNQIQFF